MSTLFSFPGGIHPPEFKTISSQIAIAEAPLPEQLFIAMTQSIGTAAVPCVKVGDRVLKGQMIATASGRISTAVHASSSGVVSAIAPHPMAHPSGLDDLTITIDCDGLDEWAPRQPLNYWQQTDRQEIAYFLRDMGLVGQGGAIFPTYLKLNTSPLETLVINGAECEPFITCDDRLMQERAEEITEGIAILAQVTKSKQVIIGIEDNKPQAIEMMRKACAAASYEIVTIPTIYPSGGAKQLIRILTGKTIPHGVRSTDFGVQCFNVGTAYRIYRAITHGEPLISRIVTLTGACSNPHNIEARIGSPIGTLISLAQPEADTQVIVGGPMMGFMLSSLHAGLHKASNCLIIKDEKLLPSRPITLPCIRCGTCATACPVNLQPMDLYRFAKAKQFDKAKSWHLFDCIECGSCSYVCPSHIPLVDFYQYAKGEIWTAEREKQAADHAKRRYTFRDQRKQREQAEKAQRLAAKSKVAKPVSKEKQPALDEDKAARIREAIAKAAAKKTAKIETGDNESTQDNPTAVDDEKRAAIQAAMARAAAKKAAKTATVDSESAQDNHPPTIDDEKRAAIQAAMARAAEKKAQKQEQQ